jgi:hypothetical protein
MGRSVQNQQECKAIATTFFRPPNPIDLQSFSRAISAVLRLMKMEQLDLERHERQCFTYRAFCFMCRVIDQPQTVSKAFADRAVQLMVTAVCPPAIVPAGY